MSKLYEIEITITAVVCADDEGQAYLTARSNFRDICSDDPRDDIAVMREIKYADQLPQGWDVDCLPYGSKGEEIGEFLFDRPPTRDTKTIDMFAAQGAQGENNQRGSDE